MSGVRQAARRHVATDLTRARLDSWRRRTHVRRTPASRSRRRPPSSSGFAPRSSRPARRDSAQFAALHPLGDGRFLAASTDGSGRSSILARQRGALRACGADLAAHCINDVITCGAEPLILLDYVAAAQIELAEVAELVEGAAEVCREAGVALIGGETAELPGIYRDGELDFAGTCVGDRRRAARRLHDRGRRRRHRLPVGRRPRERLHARPPRARGGGLRRAGSARADAALPRRRAPAARPRARLRARHRRRHPRQPRARPPRRPPRRDRLGLVGAAAGLRLARASRRRGRDAPRLQPRHRLLRRRPRSGAGRPRDRRGSA